MISLAHRRCRLEQAIANEFAAAQSDLEARAGTKLVLKPHNGTHSIRAQDGSAVAQFNLAPFPNCGAAAVLCDLRVEPAYRRVGLGRALFQLQERAAVAAQCALLLATVRAHNEAMLRTFGPEWERVAQFHNRETGNDAILLCRQIAQ